MSRHGFWRAFADDASAPCPAFWTKINDPVCGLNHIKGVLDHDHGVTTITQFVDNAEQLIDIMKV